MSTDNKINMDHMKKVPVDKATTPQEGLHYCYVDRWWTVLDGYLLFYRPTKRHWGAPQCNGSKVIAEGLAKKLYPEATVQQIPLVFVPEEYGHGY